MVSKIWTNRIHIVELMFLLMLEVEVTMMKIMLASIIPY